MNRADDDIADDDIAEIGHLTFGPISDAPITPTTDLDDWLKSAKNEFILARLSLPLLNMNDRELEKIVRDANDPETFTGMVESIISARERHEAGLEFFTAAYARLMSVLDRVYGEEETQ